MHVLVSSTVVPSHYSLHKNTSLEFSEMILYSANVFFLLLLCFIQPLEVEFCIITIKGYSIPLHFLLYYNV